jgi:hypothetical protein
VQVYDASADTWSMGPPLPLPLHHTIAAAVDGVLYVVGGEFEPSGVAQRGVYQDSVWAYDPAGGRHREPRGGVGAPGPDANRTVGHGRRRHRRQALRRRRSPAPGE